MVALLPKAWLPIYIIQFPAYVVNSDRPMSLFIIILDFAEAIFWLPEGLPANFMQWKF